MKSVITHIVTMYQEKFTQLDYVDIFEMMVKKFDSFSEYFLSRSSCFF